MGACLCLPTKRLVATSIIMAAAEAKLSFFTWRYSHYFTFVKQKEKNVLVKCNLCLGSKILSTAQNSHSNLLKHLQKQHAATRLVAKSTGTETDSLSDATSPPPPLK